MTCAGLFLNGFTLLLTAGFQIARVKKGCRQGGSHLVYTQAAFSPESSGFCAHISSQSAGANPGESRPRLLCLSNSDAGATGQTLACRRPLVSLLFHLVLPKSLFARVVCSSLVVSLPFKRATRQSSQWTRYCPLMYPSLLANTPLRSDACCSDISFCRP